MMAAASSSGGGEDGDTANGIRGDRTQDRDLAVPPQLYHSSLMRVFCLDCTASKPCRFPAQNGQAVGARGCRHLADVVIRNGSLHLRYLSFQ